MSDAVSVLGSRHNILLDPVNRKCYINRSGVYPGIECELVAGVEIEGRMVLLPLCADGGGFDFLDQDMTPNTFKLTGIDEKKTIKLELTIASPFCPRDIALSTLPVLEIRLKLSRLDSNFRGWQATEVAAPGKIFLQLKSSVFESVSAGDSEIRWQFDSPRPLHRDKVENCRPAIVQNDAFLAHSGEIVEGRLELAYTPDDYIGKEIHVSWCTYSLPTMTVNEAPAPFKYTERFASLEEVIAWAKANPDVIAKNARHVDRIIGNNNLSTEINKLMAQTLHSWLINTWWTVCEGKDWYNVWEGNCYYLSTMDVEYTQTPFYLSVWPELLALELDRWPEFTHSGEEIIGEAGKDTVVFMHDVGWLTEIDRTRYAHPMPVEQNCNYALMHYAYWRRTGDFAVAQRNAEHIKKGLDFLLLSDTTGDGVPDQGTANTIDDACPALQFGKKQVYLAVKTIAALQTGADILEKAGDAETAKKYRQQAETATASLHEKGWSTDHFNMLLKGKDDVLDPDQSGGWDATHIYTSQGLVLLDMVGKKLSIDDDKLRQDLQMGAVRCVDKYGCRHSDYVPHKDEMLIGEFGTFSCPRVGWIAMNMFRDIAAFYRGVDLRAMASRYWDFQALVNTQGPCLFFETFNGNRLMTYPRGLVVFGYFDALAGLTIDAVDNKMTCRPLNDQVQVPVLLLADWKKGASPTVSNGQVQAL